MVGFAFSQKNANIIKYIPYPIVCMLFWNVKLNRNLFFQGEKNCQLPHLNGDPLRLPRLHNLQQIRWSVGWWFKKACCLIAGLITGNQCLLRDSLPPPPVFLIENAMILKKLQQTDLENTCLSLNYLFMLRKCRIIFLFWGTWGLFLSGSVGVFLDSRNPEAVG